MNRETFIKEDKTILNTDFYLYLLKCEDNQNKLISFLENGLIAYKEELNNTLYGDANNYYLTELEAKINSYQEVLDFVRSDKE